VRAPLEGIRVLDLTILINGPWATVLLADMGAEVIKIEDPRAPDPYRGDVHGGVDPRTGIHTYFETMNRGKRSVALDLKQARGRAVFHRLVRDSDVVISNFRPGVIERLGADYATLVRHNPRIITVTASGLGRQGPDAGEGVVDLTGQARSGYLALTALEDGTPRYVGSHALADQVGAMQLAQGTLLALLARERFGVGQDVEVSQLGSMLAVQALALNNYLMMGVLPKPPSAERPANPLFNLYRARDGRWLALACLQFARFWPGICRALELEGEDAAASDAPGPDESRRLARVLARVFAQRERDEWLARLRAQGAICAPVQAYPDVARDPQVQANELLVELEHPAAGRIRQVAPPIKLSRTPGAARGVAPEHGQHTEEVLLASGYGWDEIAALRAEGVI
jgi:crotonobetainyl-CoA:carnitine CoA-transferase CaiB-like acyl-CoA transferase